VDNPIDPVKFALAAGATFVARTFDTHIKHMTEILARAHQHKGVAFVEIYQNCNIFNDGAFAAFTDRDVRSDRMIEMEHGQPLVYGDKRDKGIALHGLEPKIVAAGEGGEFPEPLLNHNEDGSDAFASFLSQMRYPEFPVPIGIFRSREMPVFEEALLAQVAEAKKTRPTDLQALITGRDTWTVADEDQDA
jgi:2-oxoglutarate ferredoxin oxidoreductase subunit beta